MHLLIKITNNGKKRVETVLLHVLENDEMQKERKYTVKVPLNILPKETAHFTLNLLEPILRTPQVSIQSVYAVHY